MRSPYPSLIPPKLVQKGGIKEIPPRALPTQEKGKITLIHVPAHDQLADIFTKPVNQATFTRLRGEVGVCLIS
jgi:hypothetical protein